MVEAEAERRQRGLGDNCCVIVKCVLQCKRSMKFAGLPVDLELVRDASVLIWPICSVLNSVFS